LEETDILGFFGIFVSHLTVLPTKHSQIWMEKMIRIEKKALVVGQGLLKWYLIGTTFVLINSRCIEKFSQFSRYDIISTFLIRLATKRITLNYEPILVQIKEGDCIHLWSFLVLEYTVWPPSECLVLFVVTGFFLKNFQTWCKCRNL